MHLIRRQDGFALPLALSMMVIVALLAGAAITFATHNTDRATRDSAAARALGAADAGVDSALYRMNKALLATQADGVLGLSTLELAEERCISLSLGELTVLDPVSGWCQETTAGETVDGAAGAGQAWRAAGYTYTVSTGINISTGSDPLIERKIVATGTVGGVSKRVLATAHATIGSDGNLLDVFEQVGYEQCGSEASPTGTPDANC